MILSNWEKEAKTTCQHGCQASLNIGENMMTKIRQCLSEFHDNPFFNLFPSDDEQFINSSLRYVELAGDFVQCVESEWGEMRWNYMWQVVLKAYMHVVDGKFDSDQMTCKKCSKKVMIASTNLYKA